MQRDVWLRKNGETVPIVLLDDHHLATILKLLQRHHHQSVNAITDLNLAISSKAWEEVHRSVIEMKKLGPRYPLYLALWEEAEGRGILEEFSVTHYEYDEDYGRVRA